MPPTRRPQQSTKSFKIEKLRTLVYGAVPPREADRMVEVDDPMKATERVIVPKQHRIKPEQFC